MARFLDAARAARSKNIVISGGTGSGKTTLLNVLSGAIPEPRAHRHDRGRGRAAAAAAARRLARDAARRTWRAAASITIRDLVKNALRMRPDRIVVGECRGGEALDMLQAMNTGHDGSLTTTHANIAARGDRAPRDAVLMAGLDLPLARDPRADRDAASTCVVQQSRLVRRHARASRASPRSSGLDPEGEIEVREIFGFVRTGTGPSAGRCSASSRDRLPAELHRRADAAGRRVVRSQRRERGRRVRLAGAAVRRRRCADGLRRRASGAPACALRGGAT